MRVDCCWLFVVCRCLFVRGFVGCSAFVVRCSLVFVGCLLFVVCSSLFVVVLGCGWSLIVGLFYIYYYYWLLVVGCWLLVVVRCALCVVRCALCVACWFGGWRLLVGGRWLVVSD